MFKNGVVVGNFQQERSMKNLVEFIKFHTKKSNDNDNNHDNNEDNNHSNNEDNNNDSENSDEDIDDRDSGRRNEVEEVKLVTLLDETFKVIVIYLKNIFFGAYMDETFIRRSVQFDGSTGSCRVAGYVSTRRN